MSLAGEVATVRTTGGIVHLSDRAKFELTGEDRVRYLNGQISQAVATLGTDEARAACVMTAKGKMSGFMQFMATGDALLLDAAGGQREELAMRLERYIIADDVELRDVTEERALWHILGAQPGDLSIDGADIRKSRRFFIDGLDVWAARERAAEVRAQLDAKWPACSPETLEILRIENGVPRWGAELDENTIPVEAGLEKTAIDYHKGCYIGQEVISRLKSIGHVNRQMRGLVAANAGDELRPGMELTTGDGKPAGRITSAARSFALARSIALGYVKRGITAETLLARADASAPPVPVEVRDLPLIP